MTKKEILLATESVVGHEMIVVGHKMMIRRQVFECIASYCPPQLSDWLCWFEKEQYSIL